MNNKNKKKSRQHELFASFKANSEKMTFSVVDGKLYAFSDKGEVELQNCTLTNSYQRDNPAKPNKVINMVSADSNSFSLYEIFKDAGVVYAVDTNTKKENPGFFSICVIIKGEFNRNDNEGFSINYFPEKVITSYNEYQHPLIEQFCWKGAIEYIQSQLPDSNKKVVLIVDCDLQNIGLMNERKKPIVDNFYLPPNFTLLYASSDVGKEFLPNKMIALSDKLANELYNSEYKNRNDKS